MARKSDSGGRVAVSKTYKLYIGGKFPRTESGRYLKFDDQTGGSAANVCRASRKDLRNAVVAARAAVSGWSGYSAYLRAQILYRVGEMLEGRRAQFVEELMKEGVTRARAGKDVELAIDRLVYYAGWADKFQQLQSTVNPVASSHFNFTLPEPMGVIGIVAPLRFGLSGIVSALAPVIAGGNSALLIAASDAHPLSAISFAEVLHASDVPAGVVNVLTGKLDELVPVLAGHMDVNALSLAAGEPDLRKNAALSASENLKRVVDLSATDWRKPASAGPYHIGAFQELKTTWHPVAN